MKHNYAMLIHDDYNLGLSRLYCTNSIYMSQPLYFGCMVLTCSECSTFINLQSHRDCLKEEERTVNVI